MFKTIALLAVMSASVSAFTLPSLDFDMAKNAIKKSAAMKNVTRSLNTEVESVTKVAKRTFLVSLANDCTVIATFGKRSKVSVLEQSLSCGVN